MSTGQLDKGLFVPYRARAARCIMLLQRAELPAELPSWLRDPRGRRGDVSFRPMATIVAIALSVHHKARAPQVDDVLNELLPVQVLDLIGVLRPDGQPWSVDQQHGFWRSMEGHLGVSELRPNGGATLSDAERQINRERLELLANTLIRAPLPAGLPPGDLAGFDTTSYETPARPLRVTERAKLRAEKSKDLLLKEERQLPAEEQQQLQRKRAHRALDGRYGHATPTNMQPKVKLGGLAVHTSLIGTQQPVDGRALQIIPAISITANSGYSSAAMMLRLRHLAGDLLRPDALLGADSDFSHSHDLWRTLRQQGVKFVFDLRQEQLPPAVQRYQGAILAQGSALCPGTPEPLRNPGKRPLGKVAGQRNPTKGTWLGRVLKLLPYRAHLRSRRKDGINVSCPGRPLPADVNPKGGPRRKVQCILCGPLDPNSDLPIVLQPPPKDHAQAICTQETVFIPDSVNPLRQHYAWGSKDWERLFARVRALIEGLHGQLKHPDGRHWQRFFGSTSYFTALVVLIAVNFALYNLEVVHQWALDHQHDNPLAAQLATDPLYGPDELAEEWLYKQLGETPPPTPADLPSLPNREHEGSAAQEPPGPRLRRILATIGELVQELQRAARDL